MESQRTWTLELAVPAALFEHTSSSFVAHTSDGRRCESVELVVYLDVQKTILFGGHAFKGTYPCPKKTHRAAQ